MSKQLINQYYNNLDRAIQFGKSTNETAIRHTFMNLLNSYAKKNNYELVPEVWCLGTKGRKVRPDGIVKNLFGLDIGLWESKDEKTNIDDEINLKIKTGYPLTNILFEDSANVILYQRGEESMRIPMRDADQLHELITKFVSFKNETIHKFEVALENFKADIPAIVETLRKRIEEQGNTNLEFTAVRDKFLLLCKAEINPEITLADVREMMIQHLLTSDIFNKIFDDPEFHRHNNIARELDTLVDALFTYAERRNLLGNIEHYYDTINAAAAGVTDHHEKQKFLKVLYENFYKVYNPKAADRLGVVYTPNEIVTFMIESTDYLLHKHFGKALADKNVDILDPATGTGTFLTAIIDHIPKHLLQHKYREELHANEVAILPYYIANLNVEFTFKQKMGYYDEFKNLCFVDTLDNIGALKMVRQDKGHQTGMFSFSSENSERIKKQNEKKISIVIGNPPYNANQANENDNNKNRTYPVIDKHIKETFIKQSTAQKTKVYDMYARFYRWAMDRLDSNGIISFITNRSFIDSRTFDGFRKCVQDDFAACYIIDTHSDVRANPKIAGTTHNVFGIQTGVAIMFLVKKEKQDSKCRIEYIDMPDDWRKEIKLDWFRNNRFDQLEFQHIEPDHKGNWINMVENDFEDLIPICAKDAKAGRNTEVIFKIYSTGISTNRDEWIVDKSPKILSNKMSFFSKFYNSYKLQPEYSNSIKWSRNLKQRFTKGIKEDFKDSKVSKFNYRPYSPIYFYNSDLFIDEFGLNRNLFKKANKAFSISGNSSSKSFQVLGIDRYTGLDFLEKTQILPLNNYDASGNQTDNITDWALNLFKEHYKSEDEISKEDIFHYTYAVLHNPLYRKKYELNLKREFPRIPFYPDFFKWVSLGKQLMDLHLNYETVEPYDLKRIETKVASFQEKKTGLRLKVKLKADKETGIIELDEQTALSGIPKQAWEYKLGNRSALEWILDQYKEKKPSDPTIAEKFNTYRFSDYKEQVIDLLKRVCRVSVETVTIIKELESLQQPDS